MATEQWGLPARSGESLALLLYRWLCRLLYSRFAWAYDVVAWTVSAGEWAGWRRSVVGYVHGACVLDLACGTGGLATTLSRSSPRGRVVVGVDRSPQMIAQAAQRKQAEGVYRLNLVQATAEALPFAAGSVTTITATFPAPYILDAVVHRECARVMKRGSGRLVIAGLWVEAKRPILRLIPFLYGSPRSDAVVALTTGLEAAGFRATMVTHEAPSARIGMIVAERGAEREP